MENLNLHSSQRLKGGGSKVFELSHLFVNGLPHNPEFLSNELFRNESNCFALRMGPMR
jgi:hypothetical protein